MFDVQPESPNQPPINPLILPGTEDTVLNLYKNAEKFYPKFTITHYDNELPGSPLPILIILHQKVDNVDDYFRIIEISTDQAVHVNPSYLYGQYTQPSTSTDIYWEEKPPVAGWSEEDDEEFYLYFDSLDEAIVRVCEGLTNSSVPNLKIASILFPIDANTARFRPIEPTMYENTRASIIEIMQRFGVTRVCGYRRSVTPQGEIYPEIIEYPFI